MTGKELRAQALAVRYRAARVIDGLDLAILPGSVTAVVGPNGSGKSTLIKALARLVKPEHGSVLLDGKALHHMSSSAVAREMAVLPQAPTAPDTLTVYELVEQGRFPHVGGLRTLGQTDRAAIVRALEDTHTVELARRTIGELSGGERQRCWIAMALAQDAPLLLLDEPTTFLDLHHQLELLDLVHTLNQVRRTTVVLVLHDLNHACRYASRLIVMNRGAVVADGPPADVITAELLGGVFRVEATIMSDPTTGVPICVGHRAITDRDPTPDVEVGAAHLPRQLDQVPQPEIAEAFPPGTLASSQHATRAE